MENMTKKFQVKLNSSNHITLHKIEEKMYTREELKSHMYTAYKRGIIQGQIPNPLSFEEWFEQNVK